MSFSLAMVLLKLLSEVVCNVHSHITKHIGFVITAAILLPCLGLKRLNILPLQIALLYFILSQVQDTKVKNSIYTL